MRPFKNLVFDIGNVIVDIDYMRVVAEFQQLATINFSEIVSYSAQHHLFDLFETGKISADEFRTELRKVLKEGVTDQQINNAWNSMLLHYPPAKFQLLDKLKENYRVFALSNINEIHINALDEAVRQKFGVEAFSDFFHTAYYSNRIGHRKPEKEIYTHLLTQENLIAHETFFVDDKAENTTAASALGIQSFHLPDRDKLHDLLAELNII